jgi:Flp pilus assembly protein TadG
MSAQMNSENPSLMLRLRRDESGAVIVLVAVMMVGLIGLAALAIDVGNLAYAQRRLQAVTDLSALAGAEVINTTSSAITMAQTYSGIAGANNAQPGLTMTMVSGYPQLKCLTTINTTCTSATATNPTANAILVEEQAQVPFLLGQVFGFGTVTLSATSLATKGGGGPPPMHIMIVLDNTASMNDGDKTGDNCGGISNPTRIQCALAGIQSLLTELWPTQDEVGLIVFPPVSQSTYTNDYSCTASNTIKPEPYGSYTGLSSSPSVYQIVGLTNTYKSTNTSTSLAGASTSQLVAATCSANMSVGDNGVTGTCGSCQGNKAVGGEGTYLAAAITAAQATLAANSVAGVQNVIIVLSDGGAGNTQGSATTSATATSGTTLTFSAASLASAIPPLVVNSQVCAQPFNTGAAPPSCGDTTVFPANTVVTAITSTTVTLSNPIKKTVANGSTVYFGPYNQCNTSITAAQAAANAGTWVYAIAYQSYLELSASANSCSDTESPAVSSCMTMQQIANSPGHIPDAAKFYSDPMGLTGQNGPCTSTDNPNTTDITSIFEEIGSRIPFAALLPAGTQ